MSDAWLDTLDPDPWSTLAAWLGDARAADLHEPEAAALATATPDGRPSVRMVLVRGAESGDLRVYTNHQSRKGEELRQNARAALCFYWGPPLRRQVRVEGRVERLSDDEARAYFDTRSRESRLGAWAYAISVLIPPTARSSGTPAARRSRSRPYRPSGLHTAE